MTQNNNRIKELREARQMTVEELADRAKLTVSKINRLEELPASKIRIHEAIMVADALEVTLRELVTDERATLHRMRGKADSD